MRRLLDRMIDLDLVLCELVLVGMVLLIGAEVLLRGVFGFSLQLTDEVGAYLLVALTFMSLAVSFRDGAFFRVEFIYERLPERARRIAALAFDLLALGFSGALAWQLGRLVRSSLEREVVAATLLGTPLWIPQLLMPIGAWLLVLAILAAIVGNIAGLLRGGAR
jgi:TRAP-type C4-dicarboxylate transport system permease small subunit